MIISSTELEQNPPQHLLLFHYQKYNYIYDLQPRIGSHHHHSQMFNLAILPKF